MKAYEKTEDGFHTLESTDKARISGTQLAGIVGLSPWATPYSVAVDILGMCDEDDVGNLPAVKAGKYLEPVIMNYLDKTNILPNTHADVLFPHYEEGNHNDWKPHFTDDVFTGHVDGIAGHVENAYDGFGIVECKTTTNESAWDWENNIPPTYYWIQASLYAHFFGYDDIYFVVGILTEEEQEHPELFQPNAIPNYVPIDPNVPSRLNVRVMKCPIYPDFDSVLDKAREFYDTYIRPGVLPAPNPDSKIDANLTAILDAQICTDEDAIPKFTEWLNLNEQIAQMQTQAEVYKKFLTTYLETHHRKGISNGKISYILSDYSRNNVDTDKMKQDGIYEQYITKTTYKVFKKGKY